LVVKFCPHEDCSSSRDGRDPTVNTVDEAVNHSIHECGLTIPEVPSQDQPVCQVTKKSIVVPFSNEPGAFLYMAETWPSLNKTTYTFDYYVKTAHDVVYFKSEIDKNMFKAYEPILHQMFQSLVVVFTYMGN
jgi:hypothetical protein